MVTSALVLVLSYALLAESYVQLDLARPATSALTRRDASSPVGTLYGLPWTKYVKAWIGTPAKGMYFAVDVEVDYTFVESSGLTNCQDMPEPEPEPEPEEIGEEDPDGPEVAPPRRPVEEEQVYYDYYCDVSMLYFPQNSSSYRATDDQVALDLFFDQPGYTPFADKFAFGGEEPGHVDMVLMDREDLFATASSMGMGPRSSYLQALLDRGSIKTNAFSWWENAVPKKVDDCDLHFTRYESVYESVCEQIAEAGNILIGAVDRAKYEGDLLRIPLRENRTNFYSEDLHLTTRLSIDLHSITFSNYSSDPDQEDQTTALAENLPLDMYFDWSIFVTMMPLNIASQIWDAAGARLNPDEPWNPPGIPCDAAETNPDFRFGLRFGGPCGPVLELTMDDLVVQQMENGEWPPQEYSPVNYDGTDPRFADGVELCPCSIQAGVPGEEPRISPYLFRRMYMVYDFGNMELAMAKARRDGEEDIVEFEELGAKVPGSFGVGPEVLAGECPVSRAVVQGDDEGVAGQRVTTDGWAILAIGLCWVALYHV